MSFDTSRDLDVKQPFRGFEFELEFEEHNRREELR